MIFFESKKKNRLSRKVNVKEPISKKSSKYATDKRKIERHYRNKDSKKRFRKIG